MLGKPKRILWPTDFSQLSLRGGKYAWGLCDLFHAEMHILHVIPPPLSPDVAVLLPADVPMPVSEPELLEASRTGIRHLIKKHFGDEKSIVSHVAYGNPWPTICEYAREKQIELIVVPTHGRTGLGRVLIGSTAERIVQHAPCPVLVVKDKERGFLEA